MGNGGLISGAFSGGGHVPTPVSIANGGTGQTTQQAAIDALTDVTAASTNEVLTKDGTGNASFQAAASGGASISIQKVSCTNGSNTTSGTLVDIPGSSITLPSRAGGFAFLSANVMFNNSANDANIKLAIYHGGSAQIVQTVRIYDNSNEHFCSATAMQALDGTVCKLQYAINSSYTATIINNAVNTSTFQSFEVS